MYGNFWAAITLFGDPRLWSLAVIGLIVFYFGLRKRRETKYRRVLKKFLLLIIPTLLIALLGSELLKLFFQIPRPCIPCPAPGCNPYCPTNFSFPSGHATTITAIVTALWLLLRRRKYLLLYVLAVLVAASRVILGVHTATDVVAGFLVGILFTLIIWRFRKKIYKWEDENIL